MSKITICLKKLIDKNDHIKINELKEICKEKEDIFLKLELEYKLRMSQDKEESFEHTNEFFYYFEDLLIGYLGIFTFGGEKAELTGMVHPSYRRKGIFKRLFNLAIEECKRRNYKKILLVCDNRSSSGLEFIKATGAVYAFSEYEMRMDNKGVSQEEKSILLRKARNSDAGEIARQNSICFGITSGIAIMPEDSEKENIITYMIELNSQIIGKIRVEVNRNKGLICGFAILPEFRKQGYGKQALKSAINQLNKNEIYDVALEVEVKNINALNLYKSCGFVEESVTDYYEVY